MAAYATVPAEAEAEKPLLNRDVRVNLKTVMHWRRILIRRRTHREQEIRAPREFHASLGQVYPPELQLRLPQWDNHTAENGNRHGIRWREVVPKHLHVFHLQRRLLSS